MGPYHQDERDMAAGLGCLLIIGGAAFALVVVAVLIAIWGV